MSFSVSAFLLAAAALLQQPPQNPPKHAPPPSAPPIPADTEPVTTTASGLKYCVLKAGGAGEKPKFGDKATVHYTGWNTDGSVFDSSRLRGKPIDVFVGDIGLIEGWNEVLTLMTAGAQWKVTIPPELGYGEKGSGNAIKPNATLIFEIELLAFEKGPDLPPFHSGDPTKQKKNESGLVYEPIRESGGAAPKPDDVIELKFAMWNPQGRLITCSEKTGNTMRGHAADLKMRLLQMAPQYMTIGSRYRFEAPPDLCLGAVPFGAPFLPVGSTTIWELELTRVIDLSFVKPDPAKQTKTASGLKYEVLQEGTGDPAKLGESVLVYYTGWLADGVHFDSSYDHGQATPFQLLAGKLIKGWLEGIALMREGSIYRFEVPPDLAYGEKGFAPKIPGNATLVFNIELVKIRRAGK